MKLSVVILNYNVRYFLELCLKSVQAAISTIDAEIIVVDNNSTDESCNMVKQLFPGVTLIENKENLGFSKGNNQGIILSKGEYICILNPDTVVAEDSFTSLLRFAQKKEKLGIIGCKLIDGAGQFLPESKRNIPMEKVAVKKIFGNSKEYYANHLDQDVTGKVDILVGAFMFVRRSVYNQVNGFDEDYFMYGEDIDLSYRVLMAGYNNYYFADTTVIHYKGESTLKDKDYAKGFYNAMQIFYEKHFKSNVLFDTLVWLGIKIAYFFRNEPKIEIKKVKKYVLVSNTINDRLKQTLSKEIVLKMHLNDIQKGDEIIFDTNVISLKEIIKHFSNSELNKLVTFKILPKKSNYIIGSNSSRFRGEAICFK
ncbi:MAG: glycosyltransferase family 2 protein [Flavobacteriaceae bacterium]|nr:glycosyltransferase family 2 protein [Flavobacteriaceae bacterium]